jgi:hypothetical protein
MLLELYIMPTKYAIEKRLKALNNYVMWISLVRKYGEISILRL